MPPLRSPTLTDPPPPPAPEASPPAPEGSPAATPPAPATTQAATPPAPATMPAATPPADEGPPADEPAVPSGAAVAPAPLISGGLRLEWHLARPASSAARDATRTGLVIAHGLPTGPASAATASRTFPELADRVARETGWAALTFSFRGAGLSPGQFSPSGWLEDLMAATDHLRHEVSTVWLAGFGLGGTLALRLAALDAAIGGVAVLATPSDLSAWCSEPAALAASAHEAGLLDSPTPEGLEQWAVDLRALDPLRSAAAVPPRPLLIVHGSADAQVPLMEARALADAAEGHADLRVVATAGHRLRHDPRVVAILLGWLERGEG